MTICFVLRLAPIVFWLQRAWQIKSDRLLVAAIFRIEHPDTPEKIGELIALLETWLIDRPDLQRMIARWMRATLMRKRDYRILIQEVDDLQGLRIMLSERIKEWALDYKAQGMQQGMQQGEALALQKLLTKRFGAIPQDILVRIALASQEQVEAWFDVAIEAGGYVEIFGKTTH